MTSGLIICLSENGTNSPRSFVKPNAFAYAKIISGRFGGAATIEGYVKSVLNESDVLIPVPDIKLFYYWSEFILLPIPEPFF